jgi:hypothetical protein
MATYLDGMDGGKHNSDNIEVSITPKTYSVSIGFTDLTAENPLDAAKKACEWLLEDEDARTMVYVVIDESTDKRYTVDLSEDDEDAVLPDKDEPVKQELIDNVLEQIKNDVNSGDVTAIEELLKRIPIKYLISYLPEKI